MEQNASNPLRRAYRILRSLKSATYTYESLALERDISLRKAMLIINYLVSYRFLKPVPSENKEKIFSIDEREVYEYLNPPFRRKRKKPVTPDPIS
ncbi:MAG: hypothetical protein IK042_01660 [Bacteroidales bacterium]|nr:hypothetical protein [Bacteroidales bacterium]